MVDFMALRTSFMNFRVMFHVSISLLFALSISVVALPGCLMNCNDSQDFSYHVGSYTPSLTLPLLRLLPQTLLSGLNYSLYLPL